MDRLASRSTELTVAAQRVAVRGVVQGVGFRPFVYRLTRTYALAGWVRNTTWGVEIHIEGARESVETFAGTLVEQAPPLARIESVVTEWVAPEQYATFEILPSHAQAHAYQLISPDVATCADCFRELQDPQDRRYRYPFTNCTNCGPRLTIIDDVPYDRPMTTMRSFAMCPDCQREYDDPGDRRFHAQPNACPVCGPQVALADREGTLLCEGDDAMRRAAVLLCEGEIVAVKGLGGFQLACDATNPDAVARLRERKHRPDKALAIMVRDLDAAREQVVLTDQEVALLTSPAAPIVLAPKGLDATVAPGVAADTPLLGVMLAYTPLHHILLSDVARPLVMTSGNLSEEPIAKDNDEALARLGEIADAFLWHNRGIMTRLDDSVWFVPETGPQPVRRARGYAPMPIALPYDSQAILGCGAELKNTICLCRDRHAFLSQHIGDMENLETRTYFLEAIALYQKLFHVRPTALAYDLHPDYAATRYAIEQEGVTHIGVQHHHAHLAACLVDAGLDEPVIGVVMDGTGYGLDDAIWGSEFLVGDRHGFERVAHLQYLPLPGGDAAARHPYRLAYAYQHTLLPEREIPASVAIGEQEKRTLAAMLAAHLNCPPTSSMGRLFDAVAALLGLQRDCTYEAQAAIALEMAAAPGSHEPYPVTLAPGDAPLRFGRPKTSISSGQVIQIASLWEAMLDDLNAGVGVPEIAARFHQTISTMIVETADRIRDETGIDRVALTGGCFQNRLLLALTGRDLTRRGFQAIVHHQVPTNDGSISLGQVAVAQSIMED